MSLDLYIDDDHVGNITHNLSPMFAEAGVYEILWRGEGLRAGDQIEALEDARIAMISEPERFRALNPPNGWGSYEVASGFIAIVCIHCRLNPNGILHPWV